MAVKGL